jgi:hypothetical protein
MQYGGRMFTPWALYEGNTDMTYCLGAEPATGAYAQGLEYSRQAGKVLGVPTTVVIPAGKQKIVRCGTLFALYEGTSLDEGVTTLDAETGNLVSSGKKGTLRFSADPSFAVLKGLEQRIK